MDVVLTNNQMLNKGAIERQFSLARVALDKALARTKSGIYDESAPAVIAIDFADILSHLCLAWHYRLRSDDEVMAITPSEFVALSNTLPNFGFHLTLLPDIDSPPDIVSNKPSATENGLNRAAIASQLSEARIAIDAALQKVKQGAYDDEAPAVMAIEFGEVLAHVCLAWHCKNMSDDEVMRQTAEEHERLSNTVPNFGFGLTLMPSI